MMDYATLSDSSLQAMASAGDRSAEEILSERYMRLVRVCARPLFLAGGSSEDLIQEGMIGLLSAIRQYDPQGGSSFHSFAERCIRSRLLSAIKSASRKSISRSMTVFLSSNSRKSPVRSYRQLQRFSGRIRRIWFWPERARMNFTRSFLAAYRKWKAVSSRSIWTVCLIVR